jgi:hypothetical protein
VLNLTPDGDPRGEPARLGSEVEFRRLDADDGAQLSLRVPLSVAGRRVEYRAQAIDKGGIVHEPVGTEASSQDNQVSELKLDYRIKPEQIGEIRVQAASYRCWVTFRNLWLDPGEYSLVEVEVDNQ